MSEPVRIERADGVATVTVENPPVNAMDDATLEGLARAARDLASEQAIRAVVLTGGGSKAFLAGADLSQIRAHLGVPGGMDEHVALTGPMFEAWRALPAPAIAAVQAHAIGGGLELALACDLIVADPRARFGLPEVKLGLMPGGGGTQRLPRRVPASVASQMLLLGELIDARRALEIGIVNEVCAEGAALERARQLAARIAELPAAAVQAIKRCTRAATETGLSEGLELERSMFLRVAAGADAHEGASAFIERRRARFQHA